MTTIERIKELCKEKGIAIYKLEKALGYSNGSISKPKQISPDRLKAVADYFNVSMEYLTSGEDTTYTTENAVMFAEFMNNSELFENMKLLYELKQLNGDLSKAKEYLEFLICKEKNS